MGDGSVAQEALRFGGSAILLPCPSVPIGGVVLPDDRGGSTLWTAGGDMWGSQRHRWQEMSVFEGDNPDGWIFHAEHYFLIGCPILRNWRRL